jgi:hypothetical protein
MRMNFRQQERKTKWICVGYMFEVRKFLPLGFPNLATHSATYTVLKMESQTEMAKCVLWFHEVK